MVITNRQIPTFYQWPLCGHCVATVWPMCGHCVATVWSLQTTQCVLFSTNHMRIKRISSSDIFFHTTGLLCPLRVPAFFAPAAFFIILAGIVVNAKAKRVWAHLALSVVSRAVVWTKYEVGTAANQYSWKTCECIMPVGFFRPFLFFRQVWFFRQA